MRDKHYDKEEQKAVQSALAKMEMEDPQIKKWKQQMAALDDKIARKKKQISEKERKERTRRLITLGATVEKYFGAEIHEGSDEMEYVIRYMPVIKKRFDEEKIKKMEEKKNADA